MSDFDIGDPIDQRDLVFAYKLAGSWVTALAADETKLNEVMPLLAENFERELRAEINDAPRRAVAGLPRASEIA